MPKSLQLPIVAGGRLLTSPSVALETCGAENFSQILNAFRDFDRISRLPGWVRFRPVAAQPEAQQYIWDGAATLLRLAELVRGDGTRWIVGASLTTIKAFNPTTAVWTTIGSSFSPSGNPWQAEVINSTLILNNGVNIPQWWEIGEASVLPIHELREAGIASVGTIAIYNGFLFVGDIVEIRALQLAPWMNGYSSYNVVATTARVASFTIAAANQEQNDVTTGAATITATLPNLVMSSGNFYTWLKKADAGAGTVITSPVIGVMPVILTTQNDIALIVWNGITWSATIFPAGTIPASDPYGITPTYIRQYVPDELAWSELGGPKNWAPFLSMVQLAAGTTIYLPFKPFNWTALVTRLAVVNAGPDGGTLGGQSLYPDGVKITAIAAFSSGFVAVPVTIQVTTDAALTYPRVISATRWTDVSTFVGKQRLGNGQRIIVMRELNGVLVIYHDNGLFINRWTAQAKAPFALREKYVGKAVPMFRDCIASVRNRIHLYPSVEGSFIQFDGLTDPVIHEMCEGARDIFFAGLLPTDRCWAVDNPTLQTIWFVRPTTVMCYRYRKDSEGVSEMNAVINAAVFARKPGGTDEWFVLGIAGNVFQWGLVGSVISTWHRDAVSPAIPARVTSGLYSFRNQLNEKRLLSYTPILSSGSPVDVTMTIQLRGTYNPSGTLSDLMTPAASIPDPDGNNYLPCVFQATFFQDELTLTDVRDVDWQLSARLFLFDIIGGVQITRSGTG